mgnify:FL=1
MLFILTGNIQIGKSRWLERLARLDVTCYGVIAPGIWVESDTDAVNDQGYEKIGISNILLPDNVTIPFAQRADIARANGTYADLSQAGRIGLGWHIDDTAIARANEHLFSIEKRAEDDRRRKLLVIDELGRLELDHESGLIEAMKLLRNGPCAGMEDTLVVVREALADRVESLFAETWGGFLRIAPTRQDAELVKRHLAE